MTKKPNPYYRQRARRLTLQALYQWLIAEHEVAGIEAQYLAAPESKTDYEYFQRLLRGVTTHAETLDQQYAPLLDRAVNQLDPIEKTILRMGQFELTHCLDIPYRVVINEAVELAKTFGAEGSHKYINSILDKLAKKFRHDEMRSS